MSLLDQLHRANQNLEHDNYTAVRDFKRTLVESVREGKLYLAYVTKTYAEADLLMNYCFEENIEVDITADGDLIIDLKSSLLQYCATNDKPLLLDSSEPLVYKYDKTVSDLKEGDSFALCDYIVKYRLDNEDGTITLGYQKGRKVYFKTYEADKQVLSLYAE